MPASGRFTAPESRLSTAERLAGQRSALLTNIGTGVFLSVITGPMMMLYASRVLGLSAGEVGGILGCLAITALLQPIFIMLTNRFGLKRATTSYFVACPLLLAPMFFITPQLLHDHHLLLFAFGGMTFILYGTRQALLGVAWQPLMRNITTVEDRGGFFGRMRASFMGVSLVFLAICTVLIGQEIKVWQYHAMLWLLIALNVFAFWHSRAIPDIDDAGGKTYGLRDYLHVIRTSKIFRLPIVMELLFILASFQLFPLYITRVMHAPDWVASFASMLASTSLTLSMLYCGRIVDAVGYKAAIRGIAMLHLALAPAYLLLSPFHPEFTGVSNAAMGDWMQLAVLTFISVVGGVLGAGFGLCTVSILHHGVEPQHAPIAMPIYFMALQITGGVLAPIGGLVLAKAEVWNGINLWALSLDPVKMYLLAGIALILLIARLAKRLPDVRPLGTADFYAAFFSNPFMPFTANQQRFNPEEGARSMLARRVGGSRNPFSVEILFKLMQDPSYDVNVEAIRQLGYSCSPEAKPRLRQALADERYLHLCDHIIWALGELRDAEAVPAIAAVLSKPGEDEITLATALRALGKIGTPEGSPAVKTFVHGLKESTSALVVASACYTLLRLGEGAEAYHVCKLLPRLTRSHSHQEILYLLAELLGLKTEWILRADISLRPRDQLLAAIKDAPDGEGTQLDGRLCAILEQQDRQALMRLVPPGMGSPGGQKMAGQLGAAAAHAGFFQAWKEQESWTMLDTLVVAWLREQNIEAIERGLEIDGRGEAPVLA